MMNRKYPWHKWNIKYSQNAMDKEKKKMFHVKQSSKSHKNSFIIIMFHVKRDSSEKFNKIGRASCRERV